MKLKYFIGTLLFFSITLICKSQKNIPEKEREGKITPLKIGDKCPDILFDYIFNYSKSSAKLSDFSGKLVIIDFWSRSCAPCIAAMPKMNKLQNQFGDRIQILPTNTSNPTEENIKKIQVFWSKNNYTKSTKLPSVISSTLLDYFPHDGVPYEVWIGPDGIVKAFTDNEHVNEKNILDIFLGKNLNLPVFEYDKLFNYNTRWLTSDPILGKSFLYYSSLRGFIPKVYPGNRIIVDSVNKIKRYYITNTSLVNICRLIMGKGKSSNDLSNIILDVRNKEQFIPDTSKEPLTDWQIKNTYSYEAIVPINTPDSIIIENMQLDLKRYLNISARYENRLVTSLKLVKSNPMGAASLFSTPRYNTTRYKPDDFGNIQSPLYIKTFNSISAFVDAFNTTLGNPRLFDSTGIVKSISLQLVDTDERGKKILQSLNDLPELERQLASYGLELIPFKKELRVFVISDSNLEK